MINTVPVSVQNQGAHYEGAHILIDGNSYTDCVFENCTLVFAGMAPMSFVGCDFRNASWAFTAHAELMTDFLKALYHGFGDYGRDQAEAFFQQIRENRSEPFSPEEWIDGRVEGESE